MKFPRNAPCPCGSGKKFKNCCGLDGARLELSPIEHEDHFLTGSVPESGDIQAFSKEYFVGLDPDEKICAYKLIYSSLLHPEVDQMAAELSNKLLQRGRSEAERVKSCSSIPELIGMMRNRIDPLNHVLFRKKLLEHQEEAIPLLIEEIKKPSDDGFLELAVRVLGGVRMNPSRDLMNIILMRGKSVYQLSIMCLLLGFFEHPDTVQFLWNHYGHFRSKFPNEKYWRGPFYGLWETWARGRYGKIPTSI